MLIKSTRQAHVDGIKALVYGASGAGKTHLISTCANPLVISAEAGLLSLADHDIPYIEISSMSELQEAYAFVVDSSEARQFEWICLDSISEVAEVVLTHEKSRAKDPRQAYGALQDEVTQLVRAFRDLRGKNVYFSAKQEKLKDDQNGALLYGPSMPGTKLGQAMPYFFDEVFALRVEKDDEGKPQRFLQTANDGTYACKDRSGRLEIYEIPDLGAIARKISGGK